MPARADGSVRDQIPCWQGIFFVRRRIFAGLYSKDRYLEELPDAGSRETGGPEQRSDAAKQ
jgi:hypothetical protein